MAEKSATEVSSLHHFTDLLLFLGCLCVRSPPPQKPHPLCTSHNSSNPFFFLVFVQLQNLFQTLTATKPAERTLADVLEEDDEFEEFEQEHWGAAKQDESDAKQWQDNWDDDSAEDQFVKNLREQLSKP